MCQAEQQWLRLSVRSISLWTFVVKEGRFFFRWGICLSSLPGPHAGQSLLSDPMHSASISWSVCLLARNTNSDARFIMSFPCVGKGFHLHDLHSFFPFKLISILQVVKMNLAGSWVPFPIASPLSPSPCPQGSEKTVALLSVLTLNGTHTQRYSHKCTHVHSHSLLPK